MKKESGNFFSVGLTGHITWFRSRWGTPILELRVDQRRILAAEHPGLLAAAVYTLGIEILEFSNVEDPVRKDYCARSPADLNHLTGLRKLAGDDEELGAILIIFQSMMTYISGYDESKKLGDMPAALLHWHAACVLVPSELIVRRPHHPTPPDWSSWFGHRLEHIYFPRLSAVERAALGVVEPVYPDAKKIISVDDPTIY